jgi:hypothetical protein
VRPTDENQPSFTRPPFMSATRRPASTDDNILARMERDSRRGGASWKRSWIAWCSLAGLAIIGLVGVLATLARENIDVHQPALAESTPAPAPAPDPYAARPPLLAGGGDGFAPLPAVSAPLPAVSAPPPVQAKPPAIVADTRPARPSMVTPKPTPNRAVAPRKSAPLAAVRPPPARAVVTSVPRQKKPAPAPAPAPTLEPAVDSDVALLSAIIMHASRHAGERAQIEAARCGAGKKCAPAPATDPLTSLKATD